MPNPDDPYVQVADVNLGEALDKEASGILAWLVQGSLNWQKKGRVLQIPQILKTETEATRAEGDDIARFVSTQLQLEKGASTSATQIYQKYQYWCTLEGIDHPYGQRQFGIYMSTKFQKKVGALGRFYLDIRLIEK